MPRLPTVPASHGLASVSTLTTVTSLHWHAELFGDDHRNTETGNRAHVDLADMHRHRAVFVDFHDGAAAGTGALDP